MSRGLSPRVALLVAQTVLLAAWIASASNWVENMGIAEGMKANLRNGSDIGKATKCDPADPVNVTVQWKPKDLMPSDQVEISVFYKAPHNFDHGVINVTLYFHEEPHPFIGYITNLNCTSLELPMIRCPIRKGTLINFSYLVKSLYALVDFPGYVDFIVNLKNEDSQEMFCLNMTLKYNEK